MWIYRLNHFALANKYCKMIIFFKLIFSAADLGAYFVPLSVLAKCGHVGEHHPHRCSLAWNQNATHQFYFRYSFLESERKKLFRLDACSGNVTMRIRRTRPCWPFNYTGEWTHFTAHDGVSNVLQIAGQSANWFISIYANKDSRYSRMVIPDSKKYPPVSTGDLICHATRARQGSTPLETGGSIARRSYQVPRMFVRIVW